MGRLAGFGRSADGVGVATREGFAEVLLEEHASHRVVLAPGAVDRVVRTNARDVSGGVAVDDATGATRLVGWSIDPEDGAAVLLTETPLLTRADAAADARDGPGPSKSHAVRVVFPRALAPCAALAPPTLRARRLVLVVADVDGALYRVRIDADSALSSSSVRASRRPCLLASLTPSDVIASPRASPALLAPLEGITTMRAVGGDLVAVGGKSGRTAVLFADDLSPACELKPPTLARLWNAVAGTGGMGGEHEIRALCEVPNDAGATLLASLRADCHLQVHELSTPHKPIAVLGAALPAVGIGGVSGGGGEGDEIQGDGANGGERAREAVTMCVGDGYLAATTREDQSSERTATHVYQLRLDAHHASVTYHSPVVDGDGVTSAIAICDGVLWALREEEEEEEEGDEMKKTSRSRSIDAGAGTTRRAPSRTIKAWPLEALNRSHPCDDLADAASHLAQWSAGGGDAAGAASALLGLAGDGGGGGGAGEIADAMSAQLSAHGVSSDVVLREALRLRELPAPPRGMPADRAAAAAIAFAAGGDRAAGADSVDAWARLATSYAAAWKSRRAVNGLVPVAGCALCVSRGGAIGVMRPLDALEATLASAAAAASAPGYGSEKGVRRGGFALPATATPATKAMTIGAYLCALLGSPGCHALDLVASGGVCAGGGGGGDSDARVATEDWLDAATALAGGKATAAATARSRAAMDDVAKAASRERRATQRKLAGSLRKLVRSLGASPADAVSSALDALEWIKVDRSLPPPGETTTTTTWPSVVEARAARQHANARVAACRGLLLFLGACRWGGERVGCDAAAAAAAVATLARCAAAHKTALIARWLVATPCAGAAAAAAAPSPPPPLAFAVLPSGEMQKRIGGGGFFWGRGSAALTAAGASLAADVVCGASGDGGGAGNELKRAVEIGAELYAGGELDALGTLLELSRAPTPGDVSDDAFDAPALLFLQALRASADVASAATDDALDAATRRATRLFFRAASGVGGEREDDELVQHLVKLLRGLMSGFPAAAAVASAPASRLEYYETLMLFFERLGCGEGAMQCAHAALREVDAAPPDDADADSMSGSSPEERRASRAARLWANLLQYALDVGDWRGAYAAVLSVPGADAQTAGIRRLVAAMCEPGDVRQGAEALVSLPFGDDRLPTVVRALEGRAASSPVDATPHPSLMLHALFVSRGRPRDAAGATLRHARRLREAVTVAADAVEGRASPASYRPTTPGRVAGVVAPLAPTTGDPRARLSRSLEAHVAALLATINALRLCSPKERSVVERERDRVVVDGVDAKTVRDEDDVTATEDELGRSGDDGAATATATTETETETEPREGTTTTTGFAARRKTPPHPKRRRKTPPPPDATTLGALLREYVLAAARAELLAAGAETQSRDAEQIPGLVASALCHGLFRTATTLATHWCEGEALTKQVTIIAATLAARAVLAQTRRGGGGGSGGGGALSLGVSSAADATARGAADRVGPADLVGGDAAAAADDVDPAAAWAALRSFLETHDTAARNFALAEAAARATLATSASIRLPQWLAARFTAGRDAPSASSGMARRGANPTALISAYVAHGRAEEAARVAIAELRRHEIAADATTRTKFLSSWFPEPLLRHVADATRDAPALAGLRAELDGLLDSRRKRAEADSKRLASFAS